MTRGIEHRRIPAAALVAGAILIAAACTGGSAPPAGTTTLPATTPVTPTPSTRSTPTPHPSASPTPFDPAALHLSLRLVAGQIPAPVLVTNAGDGTDRLFVLEKAGRIDVLQPGATRPSTFLDLTSRIASDGEQGLLGLAFHPEFASNGRFYIDYTDTNGDTVLAEYRVSTGDSERADPASERQVLGIDQPYSDHNGGNLAFGPDGYLWISSGDGGGGGDPEGAGQRLDTLLGKILRIDVDTRTDGLAYGIPPDNPFVGVAGARPEIWAYGLRNPWRFSFDRTTGDLWIGDVGQNHYEEIDHVAGNRAGSDFGWNVMEGDSCYEPASGCDPAGLTLPVAVYNHSQGCAVVGGFVYRGKRWPALLGAYLYTDYCSGTIWGLDASDPNASAAVLLQTGRTLSSFGESESGELFATGIAGDKVLRLVGAAA